MKLISMTEFVLNVVQTPNINEAICLEQTQDRLDKIYQYALFLSQPLTLSMFAPCDEDRNILEEPDSIGVGNEFYLERALDQYQQAKERVLFEGFEFMGEDEDYFRIRFNHQAEEDSGYIHTLIPKDNIIENLCYYGLTLTQQAIKQITS